MYYIEFEWNLNLSLLYKNQKKKSWLFANSMARLLKIVPQNIIVRFKVIELCKNIHSSKFGIRDSVEPYRIQLKQTGLNYHPSFITIQFFINLNDNRNSSEANKILLLFQQINFHPL